VNEFKRRAGLDRFEIRPKRRLEKSMVIAGQP